MKSRLWAASALGAVVVVVVLVVVVLEFGRVDPSPPLLRNDPRDEIPGRIVYRDGEGCAVVIDASGRTRKEVICDAGFRLTWVDRDTIAYSDDAAPSSRWTEVDIETLAQRAGSPAALGKAQFSALSIRGEEAVAGDDGELYVVGDGVRTKIADFDVPDYRSPQPAAWSPDGEWILLSWSPPRGDHQELWIVKRDGSVKGTLVSDAGYGGPQSVSWYIEGAGVTPPLADFK